ncbi:hypothetical protein FB451DRAFT_54098 [Mycena latifolia]|nr:hypothetical protein FB451DRAFT_54098 [Mycena latifolia]
MAVGMVYSRRPVLFAVLRCIFSIQSTLCILPIQMATIDATKVVSKEEFDAKVAALNFQNTAGRVETPVEEVQILANLLGVSPGTLGETVAAFSKGGEACDQCGRAFSFLDIAETGLKAHSKEFLVDVMTGKHGYIVNSGAQPFNCHNCGTKSGGKEDYFYFLMFYLCNYE